MLRIFFQIGCGNFGNYVALLRCKEIKSLDIEN